LRIHLENKKHSLEQLDISKAATELDGYTGSEIANLVNLAASSAARS
jgi:ATP-dependent Zn protease